MFSSIDFESSFSQQKIKIKKLGVNKQRTEGDPVDPLKAGSLKADAGVLSVALARGRWELLVLFVH